MTLDGDEFNAKYSETFFVQEDDMAICEKCFGKKFHTPQGYWRYINTSKGCFHKWRNASGESVEEFTEGKVKA